MDSKMVRTHILSIADMLRERADDLALEAQKSAMNEIVIYASIDGDAPELSIERKYFPITKERMREYDSTY